MPDPRFAAILALTSLTPFAALHAQENVHDVVPGRDFEEHKLLSPGLTDLWKLDVEADEMLWCVVESSTFDPVLDFTDSDGKVLSSNDGLGTRSELRVRVPATGPMQFRVRPFQGSGGGTYRFWLHRFRTQRVAAGNEASHTFGCERWWHYRIALRPGDVLVPTASGDGRVTSVFTDLPGGVTELLGGHRARDAGDYFVRVEGAEHDRCQLVTQLARQRPLPLGDAVDEALPPHGLDLWRFDVRAGSAFVLDLQMPGAALQMQLVEPAPPRDAGPAFTTPGHFDKGGHLRRLYFARRSAQLELRLQNPSANAAPCRLAVTLPDRELAPDAPVHANLAVGDGDLHRLHATAGQLLRLTVDSTAFDARLDVWDPQGNVLATPDDQGPLDRNPRHTFLVPADGDYRVLVHCGGSASGDYTVLAESLPVPELSPGQSLPVQVTAGSPGYVHLHLAAGQEVWLSLRSREFDACLQVLDPKGDQGFVCEGGGTDRDVLVAYRASHSGKHTLLLHSRSGQGRGELRALQP